MFPKSRSRKLKQILQMVNLYVVLVVHRERALNTIWLVNNS